MKTEEIRDRLLEPFPIRVHELKPGSKGSGEASAQIFVDCREYQSRLDEVFGLGGWSVSYRMLDQFVVVCALTIGGVTREDVGETEDEETPGANQKRRGAHPVFGGVAQAFRRACASFGLGRYLYSLGAVWAKFDGKKFTENPDDVVMRAFDRVGLMPRQRLEGAFLRATNADELQRVIERVKRVRAEGELSDEDRKYLNQVMNGRRKELNIVKPEPKPAVMATGVKAPTMQPDDFARIEREQEAAKESAKPAFNLTPPDPDELASGGEVFDRFHAKIKSSSSNGDLDEMLSQMRQEPALDEDQFAKLRAMIGTKRQAIAAEHLEANGSKPAVAKALSRATYQGVGGVPVPNPHTGALTPKQEKAQPQPTPRASKLIQRYLAVTNFNQLKDVNEAVLTADNDEQFDQVDNKFISEAAAERHRVLQTKADVLESM